jgi:16S rRNA (cytosine967-C5)-methyltransferase
MERESEPISFQRVDPALPRGGLGRFSLPIFSFLFSVLRVLISTMLISTARAIAFDILRRVESEGAYASDLLHAQLAGGESGAGVANLKPEDAALATELTLGVLRWRRLLDFLLAPRLKKPVDRLDLPVALALRLGLYQLRFLRRVPAHAAVNESVELVKRARKSSAASLVNAVLRRAAQEGQSSSQRNGLDTGDQRLLSLSAPDRLAILHSHPTWLVERWLAHFGELRTLALLDANNRPPRLSCVMHDPERRREILSALEKSGLRVEPGVLLKNAFAVSGGTVTGTDPFRRGLISIQDEASQAIPFLLGVGQDDRVLDLCAAPGGKTPPLIRAAGPNGLVIAADHHAHRLRAMRAQFERLRLAEIAVVELDAEKPLPFGAEFDRVLLDAPCSGSGTLARHPEIRWRLGPEQLAEFHPLQAAILASAVDALAPGGRIVYSTCSLEPEENEFVIREVLSAGLVRAVPVAESVASIAPHLAAGIDPASLFDSDGFFRTLPGARPTDGFFAAILEKKPNLR